MKNKIAIILVCFSFTSVSAFAAGFGVSGESTTSNASATQPAKGAVTSENATIAKLLAQAKKNTDGKSALKKGNKTAVSSTTSTSKNGALGSSGVSEAAFSKMVRNMMPLSPAQIKTLRYMFDKSQRAAATYPGTPPRPTSSSTIVNLSPGATPPVVRLRAGYVTSLVFLDSTGQAWPIAAYDLGDPKSFNIKWNRKGNTLLVQSMTTYKSGNLAVILKGLDTPVMVTLMPGQKNVDYRVDLRVSGLGPNAKPSLTGLPAASNPQLINFLDGVPPKGAHALRVEGSGNQSQAWLYGKHLYLRTTLTVLSPGWISSMSSPDGTHVYELPKTPVVLASEQGTMVQLTIKGL